METFSKKIFCFQFYFKQIKVKVNISFSGVGRILVRVGGTPGHQKAITLPLVGGPGAKAPRTVAKFKLLKQFKVLENESIFSKISTFFLAEISRFSTKTFEKLNWFYKDFLIFSKNYFTNFKFYGAASKSWIFSWILLSG